jgi:hypothetical protein
VSASDHQLSLFCAITGAGEFFDVVGGFVRIFLGEGEIRFLDVGILEVGVAERLAAPEVEDRAIFADGENGFADHDVVMFAGRNGSVWEDCFAADREDFFGLGDFGVEKEVVVSGGLDAAAGADGGVTGFAEDGVGAAKDEREKNAESGQEEYCADEQDRFVSAFHSVKGKAKRGRRQVENAPLANRVARG